ncbi:MAG: hypothetical protein AABN33_07760 [Acidobacteriota bacterium]
MNGNSSVRSQDIARGEALAKIAQLNREAESAKTGEKAAVSQLADTVFYQFGFPEMDDVLPKMKERIVRAEMNHRHEGKGAIPEKNVARAINWLVKQLGAPDYANVGIAQVRYVRVNLISVFPSFIGQSNGKKPQKLAINPDMSPLEAAAMTLILAYQKLDNEEFQVTPEEWATNRHNQSVAKWKAYKSGSPVARVTGAKLEIRVESAKTKELKQTITRAANTLGLDALRSLADSSLDVLGISR